MKRYIKTSEIPFDIIHQAEEQARSSGDSKGTIIDIPNHTIVIVFGLGVTEEMLREPGMLADWYIDHGFNVDIEVKDVDYITKGTLNYRSMTLENAGNKRTLRNRTVMTVTW